MEEPSQDSIQEHNTRIGRCEGGKITTYVDEPAATVSVGFSPLLAKDSSCGDYGVVEGPTQSWARIPRERGGRVYGYVC